jgi:hypothetical protein
MSHCAASRYCVLPHQSSEDKRGKQLHGCDQCTPRQMIAGDRSEQACCPLRTGTSDGPVVVGEDQVAHAGISGQVGRHKQAAAKAGGIGSEHDAV